MFEQGAGSRGPIELPFQPVFAHLQASIDLPGTNGEELTFHRRTHGPPLPDPWEPDRRGRLQPPRTQIARLFPDPGQQADGLRAVGRSPTREPSRPGLGGPPPHQQPNGIRAVIPAHSRHFVQERRALMPLPHSEILVR